MKADLRYRVAIGPGQVHYVSGDTRRNCQNFILQHGVGWVEVQDAETQEWSRVRD